MTHGKQTCKILKEIRQQIADKNEIEYVTSECHFQGECQGTCPKCEEEVRYLENELNRRRQLGKAVAVAGISLGIASAFSACSASKQNLHQQDNMLNSERILKGVIRQPDFADTISKRDTIDETYYDGTPGIIIDQDFDFYDKIDNKGICRFAEVMPKYPGDIEALYKHLRENLVYPEFCKQNGIQGTVVVEFVIEETGKISDVIVIVPLYPDCDKEAIRVVKEMPDWKPAKQNGKAVAMYYNLPIKFVLNDEK